MTRKLKKGSQMAVFSLIVIAAVILFNLIIAKLPVRYRQWDISTNQLLTLSTTTTELLDRLDHQVALHVVADPSHTDERISSFVRLYSDASDRVTVTFDDPVLHPDLLTSLDTQANTILVSCEITGRSTSIPFSDIIETDPYYGQEIAFDGEGKLTSAIRYVVTNSSSKAYTLTGHQESALGATAQDGLEKSGLSLSDLNLMTSDSIPADCSLLIINNPQKDFSSDETTKLSDYLKNGGHVLLLAGATAEPLSNLYSLCSQYGIDFQNGYAADQTPGHYYQQNPFHVIPQYDYASGLFTGISDSDAALLVNPAALHIQEALPEGITVEPLLTTSEGGVFVDSASQTQSTGVQTLGAVATEVISESSKEDSNDVTAILTVIAAPNLIDESLLSSFPNLSNLTIFLNAAAYKTPGVTSLSIPSKSLSVTYNMVSASGIWSAVFIILLPLLFLAAGFLVWMKRRRL